MSGNGKHIEVYYYIFRFNERASVGFHSVWLGRPSALTMMRMMSRIERGARCVVQLEGVSLTIQPHSTCNTNTARSIYPTDGRWTTKGGCWEQRLTSGDARPEKSYYGNRSNTLWTMFVCRLSFWHTAYIRIHTPRKGIGHNAADDMVPG